METITFYSYKGGVGRSLTLANIVLYLAKFEQDVCIVDFDLEAPGLQYKFSKYFEKKIEFGLVDYIYHFQTTGEIDDIKKYVINLNFKNTNSKISFIPAGNIKSNEYWKKLASIDWHKMFYEKKSQGVLFFKDFKKRVEKFLKPSFLIVDSRTGITETSGVCTSILADKLVFMIANNDENIDGATQILKSITILNRNSKKSVKTVLAVSRLPLTDKDENKSIENNIVNDIYNRLSKNIVGNIDSDICVIHSDRKLELKESLEMSSEFKEESILLKDYLRLFSKIIDENIVFPKIEIILDKINENILDKDANQVQEELESLALTYPNKKTYEELIKFYIFRRENKDLILKVLNQLWDIDRNFSDKIFKIYVNIFIGESYFSSWNIQYNLSIIEKYLEKDSDTELEKKLAEAYLEYERITEAINTYEKLLNSEKNKNEILEKLFNIYIENKQFKDIEKLIKEYKDLIGSSIKLQSLQVEYLFHSKKYLELKEFLTVNEEIENYLLEEKTNLYFEILTQFNETNKIEKKLDNLLDKFILNDAPSKIEKIGMVYYELNRSEEFKNKIKSHRYYLKIIKNINRKFQGRL